MPYIDQESRGQIEHGRPPLSAGELNYVFCQMALSGCFGVGTYLGICKDYLAQTKPSYQRMNDIVGALRGAYKELMRRGKGVHTDLMLALEEFEIRILAPYEDSAKERNGDIF